MRRLITFKGLEGELDMLQGMIEEAIFNPSDLSLKQDVLLHGLGRLEKKVEAEFNGLYLDQIRQLMFKVRMFGLHFASLDIRQDARVVTKAFKSLLEAQEGAEAVARFEAMDEARSPRLPLCVRHGLRRNARGGASSRCARESSCHARNPAAQR